MYILLKFYMAYQQTILTIMSFWMIFVGFVSFCCLLKREAPYGRYSNYQFGKPISARLSWFIMEFPPVIISFTIYFINCRESINIDYMLMLYTIHYIYRSVIYSYLIRDGKPLPLSTSLLALIFNVFNGTLQSLASVNGRFTLSPINIIGIIGFVVGLSINIISDHQLRMLRSSASTTPEQRYKIPRGKLFDYVSCANYFGEIVEWWGYAVATPSMASLAFALFTSANLIPRALSHHRWYRQRFDDYPRHRKAIIPWIL